MNFKTKCNSVVQFCLSTLLISFSANAEDLKPSPSLLQPTSSFAALSGAGAAAPGNASMVDANPAILSALKKQYSIFGGAAWQTSADNVEAGVFDSSTTSIATVLRVRQTFPNDETTRDRRFTLGLGYELPQIPALGIGMSVNYEQIGLTKFWQHQNSDANLGLGALYQVNFMTTNPIFIGVSANRIFDKYYPTVFDIGLSTNLFQGFYTFNVDSLMDTKAGMQSIIGGLGIAAQKFFDIKGSIGYDIKDKNFFWGAGLFFNGPVLRLYYTLNKVSSADIKLRQTAGAEIMLTL